MKLANAITPCFKTEVKAMKFITGEFDEVMQQYHGSCKESFFCFTYSCNRNEHEIGRFIEESTRLTRFRNAYKGRVVVDLSECFQNGFFDEAAYAFLYFMKDRMSESEVSFMSCVPSNKLVDELGRFYKTEIEAVNLNKVEKNNRLKIGFAVSDNKEVNNVRV